MDLMLKYKSTLSKVVLILMAFAFLSFIGGNIFSAKEYISYVENSGNFERQQSFGDITFRVIHKPNSYQALQQLKENSDSQESMKELKRDLSSTSNYIFRIDVAKNTDLLKALSSSTQEYQDLVYYLSFDIKDDFKLLIDNREVPSQFVHLERNYGLAPHILIHTGFSLTEKEQKIFNQSKEWTFAYNAQRFGLGPLNFRFSKSNMQLDPIILF